MMLTSDDIAHLQDLSREAGAEVMEVYGSEFSVDVKEDRSPLTEADRRSNACILKGLEAAFPGVPIISEETRDVPYAERRDWQRFWLVDPLDGTKEFIKRNGEFTVNIALIEKGEPVAGFVYQPADDRLYWAARGQGAWCLAKGSEPRQMRGGAHYRDLQTVRVVASRSHLGEAVEGFVSELREEGKEVVFQSAGSSLKICLVAEGAADVYPRLGPTMEWDTGAAHAVAVEAGRTVRRHDVDEALVYNKEDLLNPWFIVE